MEKDIKLDFKRLPKNIAIQALGIGQETFDRWLSDGAPVAEGKGRGALYDIGAIFRWRIQKAEESRKPIKNPDKEKNKKDEEQSNDAEILLKQKIAIQELRKKTRENDEADGLLVNKKQMEDLFFRLGRSLKENLMSKPPVYGPECAGLTGFEITTYLLKEFQKLCNSLADLNHISDHDLALEYHSQFMLGFNYAKAS